LDQANWPCRWRRETIEELQEEEYHEPTYKEDFILNSSDREATLQNMIPPPYKQEKVEPAGKRYDWSAEGMHNFNTT
jgi:hypothetical protein